MTRLFYCLTISCALFAAAAVGVRAQVSTGQNAAQEDMDGSVPHVCGTTVFNDGKEREALANTARLNPELYRSIVERRKEKRPRQIASDDGVVFQFLIRSRVSGVYDPINALLVFAGRRARIWIDLKDTSRVTKNTIHVLARGLDTATGSTSRNPRKGILDNDDDV